MLITETATMFGRDFLHNYSDDGRYIVQDGTGIKYEDAMDPLDSGRTYTESDELIPVYEEEPEELIEDGEE